MTGVPYRGSVIPEVVPLGDNTMNRPRRAFMRPLRAVLAFVLALVGVIWIGQGIGLIGGSAMTGSLFWAAAGLVFLVLAAALVALERRRMRTGH
jgi:hypothetical protein